MRSRPTTPASLRPAWRAVVLCGLLVAAAVVALQGRMPGPRAASHDPAAESTASLAGVVALLGVSFVVMAFAVFVRRPPAPKPAAREFPDFAGGAPGRISMRILLIGLGILALLLVVFVVVSRIRLGIETGQQPPAQTALPTQSGQSATSAPPAPKPRSETYRLLMLATGGLVAMMAAASVVAALRNRSALPPVVLTGPPADAAPPPAEPLAVAAERGLALVADPGLEPRAAIIACYAAMEQALADAPGAAPQASDTPSEVLARAVGNRTVSTGNAATLVELFAEARFSRHTMTEDHRDEAQRALLSVLGELRSPHS